MEKKSHSLVTDKDRERACALDLLASRQDQDVAARVDSGEKFPLRAEPAVPPSHKPNLRVV
jgi:hypothetical protein